MKHFFAIVSVLLVVVNCQNRPPRPPPSMDPKGTPVPMPSSEPQPVSPPRPKGCSPGCGPTEICAELGASYCRGGQVCSVCIKMSSIRFPASALAGMFAQQPQPKPAQPTVPVQPVVQVVPQTNPLNTSSNATIDQMSDPASTVISNSSNETQISIVEYAAKQRNLLTGVESNSIQNNKLTPTTVKGTTTLDLSQLDTNKVKYPIIVTVPDAPNSLNTPTKVQNNAINSNNAVDNTQGESHLGHIDQTQMAKWYQRYQLFKAQQAKLNGNNITPNPAAEAFDYATFQKFQQWLQQNQNQNQAQDQTSVAQTAPASTIQTPSPAVQPILQPLGTISQSVISTTKEPVQPQIVPQYPAAMQQQFLLWQQQQMQQQQQNQANMFSLPGQTNTVTGISQSTPSVSPMNPTVQPAFDFAAFQKQYQQWQQAQSQAQTTPPSPTVDYSVLHQQWLKQQQQSSGQNASNNLQSQQTSSQQIQSNTQQNPQTSQQQNTFSYVPQQPVNNYNNDPFFFNFQGPQQNNFAGNAANNDPFAVNNDPFASNNGMMDMMLFSGLGFGGGLFGF